MVEVKRSYWDEAKTKPMYESWFKDSKRHRLDGPAYQRWNASGRKDYEFWYKDDMRHRLDGPAIQRWYVSGQKDFEAWYINDIEYTKEEFDEYVKNMTSKEDLNLLSDLGQTFE